MAEDLTTRDDASKDINDIKYGIKKASEPLQSEIGRRIQSQLKDEAANAIVNNTANITGASGSMAVAGAKAVTSSSVPVAGWIAASVIVIQSAANQIKGNSQSSDSEDDNSSAIGILLVAITVFSILMFVICGTLLSKGIAAFVSVGQETEFQNSKVSGNMSLAGEQYIDGLNSQLKDYDAKYPLSNAITNYVYGTDGTGIHEGIRHSLDKAIREHCQNVIRNLGRLKSIEGHAYDSDKSLSIFYENRWPYDLATASFTPKIGNVLTPSGYGYSAWSPRYDDVNYAEILAVLGMSDNVKGSMYGLNWGNVNYEDFISYIDSEYCYSLLYELGLTWVPVYHGERIVESKDEKGKVIYITQYIDFTGESVGLTYSSAEECKSNCPATYEYDGVNCSWTSYYVRSVVKPYALRELFGMAFGMANPYAAAQQSHINFKQHTNIQMLDYIERVTRLYCRGKTISITSRNGTVLETIDQLGPSFSIARSSKSPIYSQLLNDTWLKNRGQAATGRSAWYYIEQTYNDKLGTITYDNTDYNDIDISDYLEWVDGLNEEIILTVPRYFQGDIRWSNYKLGTSTIGSSGCGFTSMAMILSYYSKNTVLPTNIADSYSGYYVAGQGMSHSLPEAVAADGGFTVSKIGSGFDGKSVVEQLQAGNPVLVSFKSGKYTSSGHLTVIVGVTKNGDFIVNDPNSRNYSKYGNIYSASDMAKNVKAYWYFN